MIHWDGFCDICDVFLPEDCQQLGSAHVCEDCRQYFPELPKGGIHVSRVPELIESVRAARAKALQEKGKA
jgi:hypothetical protein